MPAILATNHLLALGHRKLAHVRGPNVRSSLLRLLGFRRALEAAALWPQPVVVAEDPVLEARELAIADFLRRQHPPLGIVAYDDLSAVAALRAANLAGWRVPEDLSVVGIDDIPFAAYTNPGLTSVAQPKPELGALAVDLVLAGSDEPPRPEGARRAPCRSSVDSQRQSKARRRCHPPSITQGRPGNNRSGWPHAFDAEENGVT